MQAKNYLAQLKNLYKEAFSTDSAAFVEYFFDTQLKKHNLKNAEIVFANTGTEKPAIASAGYIIKKPSFIHNKKQPAHYLTALATFITHRNKGYFDKLMQQLLQRLYKENVPFAFLYPFNHSFYLKYDFNTISHAAQLTLNGNDTNYIEKICKGTGQFHIFKEVSKTIDLVQAINLNNQINRANKKNKLADNYLISNQKTIIEKIEEFSSDNVALCTYATKQNPSKPFAFCFKTANSIHYYKALNNEQFFNLASFSGLKVFDFFNLDNQINNSEYVQARIANVAAALTSATFIPQEDFVIKVIDNIIADNNATFLISKNNPVKKLEAIDTAPNFTYNINELTHLLLCGDDILVKKQKNYFCEQF